MMRGGAESDVVEAHIGGAHSGFIDILRMEADTVLTRCGPVHDKNGRCEGETGARTDEAGK